VKSVPAFTVPVVYFANRADRILAGQLFDPPSIILSASGTGK
jgi:hypothetical protein